MLGKSFTLILSNDEQKVLQIGPNLNPTVGREQKGVRPVYVAFCFSKDLFFGFPLTTKNKSSDWFIPVCFCETEKPTSNIILSQGRTFDTKRLIRKIGKAKYELLNEVMNSFWKLFKKSTAAPNDAASEP